MLNQSIRKALALALVAGAGTFAFAQEGQTTFFGGQHIVAGGEAPIFSSFTPSTNDATSRMLNNGVAPDVSSTDHIWTYVGTNPSPGAAGTYARWKWGSWDGSNPATNWANEHPNNHVYPLDAASVSFHWVDPDGATNDGWLPNNNYVYTVPSAVGARMQAATSFSIWGNFGTELGAPGNWSTSGNHLPLIRNNATQEWEVVLSGWQSIGNKEFKAVMDNDWGDTREIGTRGLGGGANIPFFLLNKADVVTFKVRESDGRYKFEGLTPLPTTDGFYALGPWTVTPQTDSVMSPVASGYEIEVTVPTAGTQTLTIFEIAGGNLARIWPAQGSHPFKTTAPNQVIRVNLHMTSMGDGAFPDAEFIYTDPNSRVDFTSAANGRLQLVGMLGMWGTRYSGTSNDWENPATDALATNEPVGTQVGSDPFLFRWNAPTTNHGDPGGLTRAYKAVGRTDDIALSTTDPWAVQLGGLHDASGNERKAGLTLTGDNPNPSYLFLDNTNYAFYIDTATGRVKVQLAADAVPTLRPARANDVVGSSVRNWSNY
jgi:hypothetical protein